MLHDQGELLLVTSAHMHIDNRVHIYPHPHTIQCIHKQKKKKIWPHYIIKVNLIKCIHKLTSIGGSTGNKFMAPELKLSTLKKDWMTLIRKRKIG